MQMITFVGGMPRPITKKEEGKKVEEIIKRVEDWKKKTLGAKEV